MNFNDYQEQASVFAKYPGKDEPDALIGLLYCVLGLCGESGEIAEKVKKVIRDNGGNFTPETVAAIRLELGDVQWYVSEIATRLHLALDDVAQGNVEKLASRRQRNVINGSGDNR